MKTGMQSDLALEPQVNVAAMTAIVQALLAGDSTEQNACWLRERARAACLDGHSHAALEELRLVLARDKHSVTALLSGLLGQW